MEMRNYKKGEIIFEQDSFGTEFYEVCLGEVDIYVKYHKPGEKLLTTLGEGRYFGEMGVIEDRVRSATAVAKSDCTLVIVSAENFVDYVKERPDKVMEIMANLSTRLRELTGEYMMACRTIAAVNDGTKEKEGWLKTHIKKFAQVYNESLAACYTEAPEGGYRSNDLGYFPMHF